MKTIKILVGSIVTKNAMKADGTRAVEFEGEEVAELLQLGIGRDGAPTDTRGTTSVLYRTDDGRLIAHIEDWSRWGGEPTTFTLHEVTEADLQVGGKFENLGRWAGYGRPLTLDEGLAVAAGKEASDVERLAEGLPAPCAICGEPVEAAELWHATTEGAAICNSCAENHTE